MGALTVWRKETGNFSRGSRQSSSDLCDAISPGDPKRAAVPRDRGEKQADRGSQPAQVGISRQHVP